MSARRSILLVAALAAGLPASAMAQRVSNLQGGRFLELCSRAPSVAICDAYLSGLADSVALTHVYDRNEGDKTAPTGFCIKSGVTSAEMRGHTVSWLRAHTDQLSKPVGELVFTALHEAYPCGDGK
ncbi:Rap1a/Tai family immunity protein [Gluconacetobacter sp. Hr-1-5]|uniref:Rap1a/Tai family immunity protein n=1 Tax=Gluconacetobacter sp. Hr-1-5 TaxID=3395370 RepID=UPI003B52EC01